jgi:thioredoxin-related protein
MSRKLTAIVSASILALCLSFVWLPYTESTPGIQDETVKWMTYDQAVALSKKNPKPIFIDVYTDWCGWCKQMDKTTFSNPKIAAYLNKKYYAVKFNPEKKDSVHYKGKAYTNSTLSASIFHVSSYPTTVYLEADETLLQPIPGYQTPNDFNRIIHYIGDNHYKTTTWEDFKTTFTETVE